ncbi:TOR2A-like protein [Mya arenaria]|uniref:TOR2A-like protein n=1 Tax=Mya arenaria TaxID=6604 RepID=A0ABY7F5Q9_MYAAR|nr:torsin-1A-like [Mya arenaria]WAR16028.1 TOR2A-like protein [Mya arenaria]
MLDAMLRLLLDLQPNRYMFYGLVAILAVLLTVILLQINWVLLLYREKVVPAFLVLLVTGALAAGGHHFLFPDACKCGLNKIQAFEDILPDNIWDQPVATEMVVGALKAHRLARSRKPLLLSFHGGTGTGKTALSMLMAKTMFGYKHGEESGASGVYIIDELVGASKEDKLEYVRTTLDGALRSGRGSLFVFESMEALPGNTSQLLRTLLEDSESEYPCKNESIFIMNTHIGSTELAAVALKSWLEGADRESINRRELQTAITVASGNTGNRSAHRWYRIMVDHGLITESIPFLPLERPSVRRCIIREMFFLHNMDRKLDDVGEVMRNREFYSVGHPVFAKKGCANISETVKRFSKATK